MTRLLIDGNSLLNAALLGGTDHENGIRVVVDGKVESINSAQHGVDGFFFKYKQALDEFGVAPRQTIVCWDGRNAKVRRRAVLPQYKEGRDKSPEVSEQLNLARGRVDAMLSALGAATAVQNGLEADDVLGYLCKTMRLEPNTVVTSDGDLSVLCDANTHVWRLGELDKNPYGPFPHRYITVYKALVGDTSDKIPGAKGFGDAAFVEFVRTFGVDGLAEMQRLIENDLLHELKSSVEDMPKLQRVIDSKDVVSASWRVASLRVEDVNTMEHPLDLRAGMVKQWAADGDMVLDLKHFYGTKTLVHADNYGGVFNRIQSVLKESPFVALDIETSSSDESDKWVDATNVALSREGKDEKKIKLDVLGHELTGMSLTFGANTQHTIYMAVDHSGADGVKNITVDHCRQMCERIPLSKLTVIQNRQFEFSVLYRTWGEMWKDNGWHGMVPNAVDTKIGASYVNENLPKGLKDRSLHHLGYTQQTYEQVTTVNGEQRKMRELTASHVFDYGCDDTICTAALHTHYTMVMEIEGTLGVYMDVEQMPEYLTSLAYVQGIPISLPKLVEMERRDDAAYVAAWSALEGYLRASGWEGSTCPAFEGGVEASDVKLAAAIIIDSETGFSTRKRKLDGIAFDLREQFPDNDKALLLATVVERNDVAALNRLVSDNFAARPVINFNSPKQMQQLFYRVIGMTPRIVNKMTDKQRENDPIMAAAFRKRKRIKAGVEVAFSDEEAAALISKASTDDTAVDLALKFDTLSDEKRMTLDAYKRIKTVLTRRGLFYRTYKALPHWRDGRIHPSLNQSEAVTRRYSASSPNIQQLPKRGEGVEFRQIILPHRKDAVVISLDWSGQELRLIAEYSGDENLTACYVGNNLRDVHSLTAVAAAVEMWGAPVTYEEFQRMRAMPKSSPGHLKAKSLREDAKTVNFATNYDAGSETVAATMLADVAVVQKFMDAKEVAFPRITPWKDSVRATVEKCGFATTMLGARRHLRDSLMSDNRYDAQRAGRQGPNFEIQSSGAEMAKLAMGRAWASGVFTGQLDTRFYAPVHDELVWSAHRKDALESIKLVHAAMTAGYADMKIPIVASVSLGRNYGEQIECGDFVDAPAINAALAEIFDRA